MEQALPARGAQDPIERFRTSGDPDERARAVRIGFVFGPRALRRFCQRSVTVVRADGIGRQRRTERMFRDAGSIARFWVRQLNESLRRARIGARLCVGAVASLDDDETRPLGPDPGARLADLFEGRVRAHDRSLALECWAGATGVNCVLLLLDWAMSRARVQRGAWAGLAPLPPVASRDGWVFHPVAVADLRCALTAHTLAHEFGHLLGCTHEDQPNRIAPHARGFAAPGHATFSVMAAARSAERGRRLEWSRPSARPGWSFGDARHDEAAWLREALPLLARQRFACAGTCGGVCARARA